MREGSSVHSRRLDHRDRLEILDRISRGETQPQVALAVGTTERTVRKVLAAAGGTPSRRSRRRARSSLRLSLCEREEIRAGIARHHEPNTAPHLGTEKCATLGGDRRRRNPPLEQSS